MYNFRPNIIIGFHGCSKDVATRVINGKEELEISRNNYDWLGDGVYFWENDYERALEFAIENNKEEPFVIGAAIYLGNCLDLTIRQNARILKEAYSNLLEENVRISTKNVAGKTGLTENLPVRFLDCAVIKAIHDFNEKNNFKAYDSVRAAFWEGEPLYETAGFYDKNHIQLCIRNTNCILGYFLPKMKK